jgi:t-SNARE complex subunit (syntaxin)
MGLAMKEAEIHALIRKERNSINDELNEAFRVRDVANTHWETYLSDRMEESMNKLTQHLEGEFLRRQHYLERHFEKEIKERRRWFPKWWK